MPKKKKPRIPKPREPFWRLRRALRATRVEGARAYRRATGRKAERDARRTGGEESE